ncbi:MAG: hypothetical protein JW745_05295 [Sedimentisphaerales bacterium]|nr:hypothetical protein [Sedimentisphaerales bacterium]MBN2842865.1 hypothetical protein [Sedimentisphaerales bacterium]
MAEEKKNNNNKVTIKIPRQLYDKLALVIDDSGYNSVTDFVTYVLRDLLASRGGSEKKEISSKDMEDVKDRLKSLGYL